METFQSDQLLSDTNHHHHHQQPPQPQQQQQQQHQHPNHYHQPAYNKYGTISGFSNKTNYLLANNNQYTNQTYNSNNIITPNVTANTNNNNNSNSTSSSTTTTTTVPTANSRFRAINRSFRTAVDKSFDMPNNSGIMAILLTYYFRSFILINYIYHLLSTTYKFCFVCLFVD